jgi:hypothetical protein
MNIKLTRQIKRGGSFVKKDTPLTVSDKEGQSLVEQGLAQPFMSFVPSDSKAPANKGEKLTPEAPADGNGANETKGESDADGKTDDTDDNNEEDLDETTDSDESEKEIVDTSSFRVIDETAGKADNIGVYVIPGIDSATIDVLVKAGYTSIESLKALTMDALVALPKIGYTRAKKIFDYVKSV